MDHAYRDAEIWVVHLFHGTVKQVNLRIKRTSVLQLHSYHSQTCRSMFQFAKTHFSLGHGPGRKHGGTNMPDSSNVVCVVEIDRVFVSVDLLSSLLLRVFASFFC